MEVTFAVRKGENIGSVIKVTSFPAIFGRSEENFHSFTEPGVADQHFILN